MEHPRPMVSSLENITPPLLASKGGPQFHPYENGATLLNFLCSSKSSGRQSDASRRRLEEIIHELDLVSDFENALSNLTPQQVRNPFAIYDIMCQVATDAVQEFIQSFTHPAHSQTISPARAARISTWLQQTSADESWATVARSSFRKNNIMGKQGRASSTLAQSTVDSEDFPKRELAQFVRSAQKMSSYIVGPSAVTNEIIDSLSTEWYNNTPNVSTKASILAPPMQQLAHSAEDSIRKLSDFALSELVVKKVVDLLEREVSSKRTGNIDLKQTLASNTDNYDAKLKALLPRLGSNLQSRLGSVRMLPSVGALLGNTKFATTQSMFEAWSLIQTLFKGLVDAKSQSITRSDGFVLWFYDLMIPLLTWSSEPRRLLQTTVPVSMRFNADRLAHIAKLANPNQLVVSAESIATATTALLPRRILIALDFLPSGLNTFGLSVVPRTGLDIKYLLWFVWYIVQNLSRLLSPQEQIILHKDLGSNINDTLSMYSILGFYYIPSQGTVFVKTVRKETEPYPAL